MERQGRSLHPHVCTSAPDGLTNTEDRLEELEGEKRKWRRDAHCLVSLRDADAITSMINW